jgi:periplasmic glucans biosynthesis protein
VHPRLWLLLAVMVIAAVFAHSSALSPQHKPAPAAPVAKFGFENIQRLAEQRANEAYRDQGSKLPDSLTKLSYDDYRSIQFRADNALWRNQAMFEVQFFHRGSSYDRRVNVTEVSEDGVLHPVNYNASQFDYGKVPPPKDLPADLGFAGLRVHYPLQRPDYKDELIAFLGASYFRVLGRDQNYGASARGLAVNVASTAGEEYTYFTDFWLMRPTPDQRTLTIYALLDSPSVAGAYRFEIVPGAITTTEVSATLYPRKTVDKPGLASMTSMFFYGKDRPKQLDDFRPEVHDSDGLKMQTGSGEWLWRPLNNPKTLRISNFSDEHPRGFGLTQRERDFAHYQDEDAHYQQRPSYWVAPLGDWGKGTVELVEVPTDEAIHDNIVAFWAPSIQLQPHKPFSFSYLLSAYAQTPAWPPGGRVIATRSSAAHGRDNSRRILIDFAGGDLEALTASQPVKAVLSAHNADIDNVTVQRLVENGVWRVSFRLQPKNNQAADLHCYLTLYAEALTESWTYLWTP